MGVYLSDEAVYVEGAVCLSKNSTLYTEALTVVLSKTEGLYSGLTNGSELLGGLSSFFFRVKGNTMARMTPIIRRIIPAYMRIFFLFAFYLAVAGSKSCVAPSR